MGVETENVQPGLTLVPGVRQEQILSAQLRESLRVLQMDLPTLVGEMHHAAETNPVVEIEREDDSLTVSEALRVEKRREESYDEATAEDESNPSVSLDEDAVERRQRFFDRQVASESLQEHLLAQLGTAGFGENERSLAELIIGDIDDDGRYVGSFKELSEVTGASDENLTSILERIQLFDPPGVGGRNLRECLGIQARHLDVSPWIKSLLLRMIDNCLGTVARRNMDELSAQLGVSHAECRKAIAALRTLEPKPGRPFLASGKHPQYIRPELTVERFGESISLSSCEHELPTLSINPMYREMAQDKSTPRETRQYLKKHIGSAELLQTAIRRRGETIMRVAEAVFEEQYDFFNRGFEALHPLTIEEIARRTGYHGTTVGRAVRGKYVRTPRGVFELSRFFCVGKIGGGEDGGTLSAISVKCRLAALVKAETDEAMTDEQIAACLGKLGMKISRRTVAKYRGELGIPPASVRCRGRDL